MKDSYTRNIKVTMDEVIDGQKRRSSTTLSYDICDYYFATILYPKESKVDGRYKDPKPRYRKWLEKTVRDWAKQQEVAQSSYLERKLLENIYNTGYKLGLDKNKDNLGLDL